MIGQSVSSREGKANRSRQGSAGRAVLIVSRISTEGSIVDCGAMARTVSRSTVRVCPYYRLPQFGRLQSSATSPHLPVCNALDPPRTLDLETASTLCRSGKFPTCHRYQHAQKAVDSTKQRSSEPPLARRLLISALWVIGIPTGITLLILIAAWITENLWAPTQQIVGYLAGAPWN